MVTHTHPRSFNASWRPYPCNLRRTILLTAPFSDNSKIVPGVHVLVMTDSVLEVIVTVLEVIVLIEPRQVKLFCRLLYTYMASQLNVIRSCKSSGDQDSDVLGAAEVDRILSEECRRQPGRSWPRLDNTERVILLRKFAESYVAESELADEETVKLKLFLEEAVRRKKLVRVKEVVFDKDENKVTAIPGLSYNPEARAFALKRLLSHRQKKAKDDS